MSTSSKNINSNPRDPSIQIIHTLGPKVCKQYMHWSFWILRVRVFSTCEVLSSGLVEGNNLAAERCFFWANGLASSSGPVQMAGSCMFRV